jgi:choline dehydrogenase-like flavoprotein
MGVVQHEVSGRTDAIVVGTGASGGLAALELAQAGLRVLVLDAAWRPPLWQAPFRHAVNELAANLANPAVLPYMPPRLVHQGRKILHLLGRVRQPVQTKCYAWERRPEVFVDDRDNPYTTLPDAGFTWLRARTHGGRVVVPGHGRQYFRLGPDDFDPPDGNSPRWPLAATELDPWYRRVEALLQINGTVDGLAYLPDSDIAHTLTLTPAERALDAALQARWPGLRTVLGRYAPPFDSMAQALATGRVTLRPGAIVRHVETGASGGVDGVAWIDAGSGTGHVSHAPIVFLCASALESTRILMLSRTRSGAAPGAASGQLGRNLMDHVMTKATGEGGALAGEPVRVADGRCLYLPRFDARDEAEVRPGRGFGVQLYQVSGPTGMSYFTAVAFAEMLPRLDNAVALNPSVEDRWGIPTLTITCSHSGDELRRAAQQAEALREIAHVAQARLHPFSDRPAAPGSAVHECGTARMGSDPASSVLDPYNQCWDVRGLYVTDSACFPSQGSQNPTLTVMALTSRAVGHAVGQTPRQAVPAVLEIAGE